GLRTRPELRIAEIARVRRIDRERQRNNPLASTPTGLAVGLALSLRYAATTTTIRPYDLGPPFTPLGSGVTRLNSQRGAREYTNARRCSVNPRLLGGDRDVAARRLRRGQRVLRPQQQELGRLLAVPARDARGCRLVTRRRGAHAVDHLDRLAQTARR